MVNLQTAELDLLFYALSDSTRRNILAALRKKTHTITELAAPFNMSLAAVSKHIKILEKAKLLIRKKEGRIHSCRFDPSALKTAEDCLHYYTQFWNQKLDLFTQNLETTHAKRKK